jgi:hypothetical protein
MTRRGETPEIPGAGLLSAWRAYAVDAWQRSVLFLDVLRRRGNALIEHAEASDPHVLSFDFDVVLEGRTLPRPVNYWLARIRDPKGREPDPAKRPFIIVDPRAGRGPGIGGFRPTARSASRAAPATPAASWGSAPSPSRARRSRTSCAP